MSRRASLILAATALILAVVAGLVIAERIEQAAQVEARAVAITGGDPQAGKARIRAYGCGGCHDIPGVPQAHGKVGPPLGGIGARVYIAGRRANTPANLMDWIAAPHAIDPETAMPTLGVTSAEARDIAAYLYTLD